MPCLLVLFGNYGEMKDLIGHLRWPKNFMGQQGKYFQLSRGFQIELESVVCSQMLPLLTTFLKGFRWISLRYSLQMIIFLEDTAYLA